MYKPNSLRAHLSLAVPELARDPDKLSILVRNGRVISTGVPSYSFQYAYTLQIVVLDYASAADAVVLPMLVWMRKHQPEVFDNEDQRAKAIRFEVEYNNTQSVDLMIELDLTERVIVTPQPDQPLGQYNIRHVPEPLHPGIHELPEHWEFWVAGSKIAEWDHDPRTEPT